MFPSSGLFAWLPCPFPQRCCKRPHCWYKHAEDGRRLLGYTSQSSSSWSSLSPVDVTVSCATQVVLDARDESFQELERINKKIETAKYEVEQERRRLSRYRAADVSPTEAEGENANKGWYGPGIKAPSQSGKYVLDNSKPRTDLEYDPMSNFTAEFRSYKSSGNELKGKSVHQGERKKPVSHQVVQCCPPTPKTQDDSYDDSILIIDIPASPDRKSPQDRCDPTTRMRPEQEMAWNEDCDASASVIDLTKCVEGLDGKCPDSEVACFQAAEFEMDQDNNLDEDDKSVCVEITRQTTECRPIKKKHCTTPDSHQEPAEAFPGSSHLQPEIGSSPKELLSWKAGNDAVIVIGSSSDEDEEQEELDMELSDGDPTEECYRIFMEANNEESSSQEQPEVPMEPIDVAKPDIPSVKPQELPAKRRIAHDSKDAEVPGAKRRPQPLVLVPLQGPATPSLASRPATAALPKTQQVQQKAAILTAALKGGQAFLSSIGQKKQERQSMLSLPPVTALSASPATQRNAYINYVPVGSAVLNVGDNLRLILPQGTLPITSTSSDVTSVLTPITQLGLAPINAKPGTTSAQKYRPTTPLLIPAAARRLYQPSSALALLTAASKTPSQAAIIKPGVTKRKAKQQCEAAKDKVPRDIRQRYVTQFTEVFLDTSTNIDEAFNKALAEEKTVYNRSVNKLKYLSVAVNALKRLKKQNSAAASDDKLNGKNHKGNIPLNRKKLKENDDTSLYEILRDYVLSEEHLIENNYPIQHPEKPGCAVLLENKKGNNDPLKRICCRCGATYSVNKAGKHTRTEECNYHYGKGVENRVPGGVETRYSCCQGVIGAPGCQIFKLHVHDSLAMDGFVATVPSRPADSSCPGVYALNCELCYTIYGLELSRVTVVDSSLQVVYDTFVKPHNEVIDYNTRFSGISEQDMRDNHTSLAEVQKTLLSFICADTVLIGHGLETDLCALKCCCQRREECMSSIPKLELMSKPCHLGHMSSQQYRSSLVGLYK
ncbi:putative exonuclease GOR isoform X2 [Phyllopteryx taeniolatus]|uniref:putative exonuclease GOR isoform X2 n=1 Tax=Phyllopteryx taeniolatus TaxID=161469 RepID=UPI002AD2A6F9|nr:putative exonuclease GOR isoform X2 [Phyllopteryx taeniolatus]